MIKKNIPEYYVSEFNKLIRDTLESNFGYVRIRGEISELKTAAKGQIYITIKDENSILSAVIWKSKIDYLSMKPEIGMEIIAVGKITTWFRYKTTYQLDIDELEIAGEGALLKIIEKRKKRLEAKGIFDDKHKKTIPFLPDKIGIISSSTGSVIHDIINRLKDRFPINVDLWSTPVQGNEAPVKIIEAIEGFNSVNYLEKPDVIIIARGGGSVEDLMAFNDENLALTVFKSDIPIISAIGHQTDNTIIDFVSDLSVPTPTAAAEKVSPVRNDLIIHLHNWTDRLSNSINNIIHSSNDFVNNFTRLLRDPKYVFNNYNEKFFIISRDFMNSFKVLFDSKNNQLKYNYSKLKSPKEKFNLKKIHFQNLFKNLDSQILYKFKENSSLLKNCNRLLNSNSISNNLKKGYVLIEKDKKIIKKSIQLKKNNDVKIKFFDKKISVKLVKN